MDLLDGVLRGDKKSISRLITLVENRDMEGLNIYEGLYPRTGRAKKIGITGPPGAGKSTLLDLLVREYLRDNFRAAVIAIDPSSPFSGGAVLGDRIRMNEISRHESCFVRSMASRGSLGGVSRSTMHAVNILDAAGYDYIFIETVGVGQSEIEVVRLADMVVLLTVPDLGDDIQAFKAGIMEIGDLMVVNKADREGADRTRALINSILSLKAGEKPEIVSTDCIGKRGIGELRNKIDLFLKNRIKNGEISERRRRNILEELMRNVVDIVHSLSLNTRGLEDILRAIEDRKYSPDSGAKMLIKNLCSQEGENDT